MTFKDVKEHLSTKLKGDNSNFVVTPLLLKEAIFDVLRHTKPTSYIEATESTSKYFRTISNKEHLRIPKVEDPLDDATEIDMEEELCMAVVFFLCAYGSFKNKELYEKKALNVISVYDTNIIELSEEE